MGPHIAKALTARQRWLAAVQSSSDTLASVGESSLPRNAYLRPALPQAMPGRPPYEHEMVKKWTGQTAASDGFEFVPPEYNYGPSAVLKNVIDWVYPEWNRRLPRLLVTEVPRVLGLNFAGCHRCSGRRSGLISTAALKELAIAIPAATHNTI